jgi:hypothetical protein
MLFEQMSFSDQEIDTLINSQITTIRDQIAQRLKLSAGD